MNKADSKIHIRNGVHRLCRQTSRLNLYVQNARVLDNARVASELKQLSIQLNELSNHPPTKTRRVPITRGIAVPQKKSVNKKNNQKNKRNF